MKISGLGREASACPDLLPNRVARRTDNLKIYGRRSRCTQAVKFFKSSLCDRTNIDVAALGQEDALIAKKPAQCTEQRKFPAVPWKRKSGSPDDALANTRKQGISGNITILSPCSVILMPVSETIGSWNSCVHYMISFHDNDAMVWASHNALGVGCILPKCILFAFSIYFVVPFLFLSSTMQSGKWK
ncbi:hypothetical protein EJB05_23303, partial [Eragrostis curvula]